MFKIETKQRYSACPFIGQECTACIIEDTCPRGELKEVSAVEINGRWHEVSGPGRYYLVASHSGSNNTLPGERGCVLSLEESPPESGYDHRFGGDRIVDIVTIY